MLSPTTVFIQIVAVATINFVPSSVRLLIEGGYYTFHAHVHTHAMIVTAARACVPYIWTYVGHRPPNEFIVCVATIWGRLLFFCTRTTCGYYSRAATIRCAAIIRINTVVQLSPLLEQVFQLKHDLGCDRHRVPCSPSCCPLQLQSCFLIDLLKHVQWRLR